MINESIHIQNIGALKDVSIPNIQPLTVLIGDSASGKSTLMKIISLMRYIYKRVNIRAYLKNSNIDDTVFKIRFNDYLRDGMRDLMSQESSIVYIVEINGHSYTISYKQGKLTVPNSIPNQDLIYEKESWISEMRNVLPAWVSKGSLMKGTSLGYYFDETLKDFNEATDVIKNVNLEYLKLKLDIIKGGNNQKKYILTPDNNTYAPFELKYASSGTLSTAPLITVLKYFTSEYSFKESMRRSIINLLFDKNLTEKYQPTVELTNLPKYVHLHIEEPELSLDPRSQRKLINEMMRYLFHSEVDWEVGMVLATHSPYILNQFNLLIKASYSKQGQKSLPYVLPENIAAFKLAEGKLYNLMAEDEDSRQTVINTFDLSETMEDIYDEYVALP